MSKISELLDQIKVSKMESLPPEQMKLDPFEHKPEPTFFQRVKALFTFDRAVVLLFVVIAALVLTYRSGIHKRVKSFEKMSQKRAQAAAVAKMKLPEEVQKQIISNEPPALSPSKEVVPPQVLPTAPEETEAQGNLEPTVVFVPYMTIQAAIYVTMSRAEKEVKWLKDHGYEAFTLNGKKHFVVCVGKYDKKQEADKAFKKMKTGEFAKRYKDAYVRSVKNQ